MKTINQNKLIAYHPHPALSPQGRGISEDDINKY